MVAIKPVLVAVLPLLALDCAQARAILNERASSNGLQNRWDTILKQVGVAGMSNFCQGILEEVTMQTTVTIIEPSLTTAKETARVTEFQTSVENFQILTGTVETVKTTETQKVTTLVPIESMTANKEKRGNDQVPAGMTKAFDAFVRDNRDFVVAQCKAAKFAPITMTSTITATQTTPTIVATQTSFETDKVDVTTTNEVRSISTVTVTETSTVTEIVTVPIPFPVSSCPDYISTGRVPWAIYSNLDISGTPGRWIGMGGVNTREECHKRCQNDATCIADTYMNEANAYCYLIYSYDAYFNGAYKGALRGKTCQQTVQEGAPAGYNCCTQYRAS